MKCRVVRHVCLFKLLFLPVFAGAVTADNPYHTILDRNPFGLNPPTVVQPTNTVEPPKNIKFNGITLVGGVKKAFFTIPGKEPKDPPQYVTLAEAEHADVLEVTKIFKEEGEVEVVNSGIKMVLNFKNNGNKGQTAPPAASVASAPVPQPTAAPTPVVYNPSAMSSPVVATEQSSSPVFASPVQQPALQLAGRGRTAALDGQQMDPAQQRANMLAQHAAATAAYDRGETSTYFRPQTDPKVYAPGGVPVRMRPVPPPPSPISPSGAQ